MSAQLVRSSQIGWHQGEVLSIISLLVSTWSGIYALVSGGLENNFRMCVSVHACVHVCSVVFDFL